jgi:hypothetical protein
MSRSVRKTEGRRASQRRFQEGGRYLGTPPHGDFGASHRDGDRRCDQGAVSLSVQETGCDTPEVSGGGYARAKVATGDGEFLSSQGSIDGSSVGSRRRTENLKPITFPEPRGDWGKCTHFGLWDSPSGGNLLLSAALGAPAVIKAGYPAPEFAAGELVVEFE